MIKSIQILRAIAAISVAFFHYNFYNLKIGDFGVDIFFIISGFIIAYVVSKTTSDFFLKRIIRVVPLYYVATALTAVLALSAPILFKHVIVNSEGMIKSLLFIPYRIQSSGPILSLGWTLNNEMFFYVIMALCIIFIKAKRYIIPACGISLILLLIVLNLINTDNFIVRIYAGGLIPEFILGLVLYYFNSYFKKNQNKPLRYLFLVLGFLSFIFLIYSDLNVDFFSNVSKNIYRGIPALLFVNAFLLLEDSINKGNRLTKLLLRLGDASYAMYLFHPFIIFSLQRVVFKRIYHTQLFALQLMMLIVSIASVCFVSILLYEYLDKPILDRFKKIGRKPKLSC